MLQVVTEEDKVPFPAVTICNLNPLNIKEKLRKDATYSAFIAVQEKYEALPSISWPKLYNFSL